ncbi:MAG: hypothetical protein ACOC3V_01795 [bacterium]
MIVTKEFLNNNPEVIFVFGDNTLRIGKGGAAVLRDEPNVYGFITKKFPDNKDSSFYKDDEYKQIYQEEIKKLKQVLKNHPFQTFLISKIGAGLANKYNIFEKIIFPNIKKDLEEFENIKFLF